MRAFAFGYYRKYRAKLSFFLFFFIRDATENFIFNENQDDVVNCRKYRKQDIRYRYSQYLVAAEVALDVYKV